MEPIFEVINALNALTDALTKLTEQITHKEMDKFEQIYPPAEEQQPEPINPKTPAKSVTLAEVRAVLANKSRAGFTEEVKQLLMKHGAEKLSGIAETEYAALLEEAEKLGS